MINRKRLFVGILSISIALGGCSIKNESTLEAQTEISNESTAVSDLKPTNVDEWLEKLSVEEKAAQMVQGAVYSLSTENMKEYSYGSVLSTWDGMDKSASGWKSLIREYQTAALESETGIPFIYGNDAVHGVNTCDGAVIFPHNIGIGAANDPELTYEMGLAVADEAKITGMLWDFAPCVALSTDPRWGRTYESYAADLDIIKSLSTSFAKGLIDAGILPCAKHFIGDGNVKYGTGEDDRIIDRGDATLSEAEIQELASVYKALIGTGVKSIMISHSSVNGEKLHASKALINDLLKGELGFDGIVVSDWESIHNIPGSTLKEQTITAINAGIDMLMEPDLYEDCRKYIIEAVNSSEISIERVDDAVRRILQVKYDMGIFEDPMMENLKTEQSDVGSDEYRNIARQLVEKSLVLLKNDNNVLPIKSGTKIYITGPAMNNTGLLCGGWTLTWLGSLDKNYIKEGKTILDGFNELAEELNLEIIIDDSRAEEADITVLCISETTYAEWEGDTTDLSITGEYGHMANASSIEKAKTSENPTVALITAGRNVIYDEYESDWDSVVMCYLPGSEGNGIANVLTGKAPFEGKLAMPYYSSIENLENGIEKFSIGYGLEY